jgi:hypothetical protein
MATTPTAWLAPPCGALSRTACLTVPPVGIYGVTIASLSPLQRSRTGSRQRGKKGRRQVEGEYLDDALAAFSGYIAIDELYDGPFCVLSIVDNRTYRRLTYRVLDHSPKADDIACFLTAFKKQLDQRRLTLKGVTTDGSNLYPGPLALVFNGVPHQVCSFHVIKELTLSVLRALAGFRKRMKAKLPRRTRGRPGMDQRVQGRRIRQEKQRMNELFENRYLFVTHHLTAEDRQTLRRITHDLPELRLLRQIMDQVYELFDRQCRSETALEKLALLRKEVKDFKEIGRTLAKLYSLNLEKALTFLDDSLLPCTSNAVERGNRRHRKMQKTVYRVRTLARLEQRMALDLLREMHANGRSRASGTLHKARTPTRFNVLLPASKSVTVL